MNTPSASRSRGLSVALTPAAFDQTLVLNGRCQVAVIDVFRATTTVAAALEAGAASVIPVTSAAEAFAIRRAAVQGTTVLAGELNCRRIDGFDLGNSPREMTPEVVSARDVVLVTSHGTRAIDVVKSVGIVWIAAFTNLTAVCGALAASSDSVIIVCSGTDGEPSLEDTLLAGLMVDRLLSTWGVESVQLNDSAQIALGAYLTHGPSNSALTAAACGSVAGRRLKNLGFGDDLPMCMVADTIKTAARLIGGRIRLAT